MRRLLISLAMISALGAAPARSQAPSPDRLADELAGINRTLDRLVRLMEAAEVRNEADLLLRRIDLMERRVAPLQSRVNSAQSEVQNMESEIRRLQTFEQNVEAEIDNAVRAGTDQPDSDERQMLAQVRVELRQLREELDIKELRKRQTEDELADARDEIKDLDDALTELLNRR